MTNSSSSRRGRGLMAALRPWRRREAGPLVLMALVTGAFWSFLELADEVREGETETVDEFLLLALRVEGDPDDPIGPLWLEELARDVTAMGSMVILIFVTAASIIYLLLTRKTAAALFVFVAVAGGTVVSSLLKTMYNRSRPDLVAHGMDTFTASFPSGHALLSTVTWLTLGVLLARVQPALRLKAYLLFVAAFISIAVGVSRVYLGVHWPSDVLAGWCIGAGWALGCWLVATLLQRRGRMEREDSPEEEAESDSY